ncbi:hypothetical protein CDL15_Pgr010952 [Punica granatum]|uniref:Histone deacetylase interacting domain-containing protein n=1 Tax=Punica granatum TaxID=22663 RepID=A0A218XMX4_PUNGR|nr:hypothetical protein CDL15_Pgr010952 [Punica granatum]PKI33479.1 hypothetical protein CRG98_046128 [Punica granatum]
MVKVMPSLPDAIEFVHKVRDAFGNESLELHLFYEALREFSLSRDYSVFIDKVPMLLGGRPDLLRSLNFFMPDECKIEVRGEDDPHHDKAVAKLMFQSTIDFVNMARIQLMPHPGVYESFVEIVSTHRGNLLETYSKVSKLFKDFPELLLDCSRFFPKSVIERATEPETRYLPSYRLLPEAKAKSSCPRSSLAAQVLNHQLVLKSSVPTSSSSGNQQDDELSLCEDYRYELDMLIETTRSAITHIKSFLGQGDRSAGPIKGIRDHLITADLRCIEQIYGEHGLEMVDEVQKKPTKALPVVLRRLEQRVAQWVGYRSEMNELWKQFRQSQ